MSAYLIAWEQPLYIRLILLFRPVQREERKFMNYVFAFKTFRGQDYLVDIRRPRPWAR